ncbi:MAG: ADP-ribosylation factor-like protein [Holophagaceae bacterium]|nr:ADP-ribosylation factor-like protein [Holophagaceae bacterium]
MVLFNAATKELTAKIVYYGPGLCGKTTNLTHIYGNLPDNERGKMLSLNTETDRTLFFDFLPINLGTIKGIKTRIQLYTVPGQVFYDTTRKLVLRGADAAVFIADSQAPMLDSNKESFQNLIDNLAEQGVDLGQFPHVIQWNKRDTPNAMQVAELEKEINRFGVPTFEACATSGEGVHETLEGISKIVLNNLSDKYGGSPFESSESSSSPPTSIEESPGPETAPPSGAASTSIEIPIVLERKHFQGPGPFEVKIKLFLK